MADLKKMYTTILGDHFPLEMKISFGEQTLVYRKRTWAIPQEDGSVDERGIRYGEKRTGKRQPGIGRLQIH